MDKYIVAISGKRCSGKTTFAEETKDLFVKRNTNVIILSIANKLKERFCKDNNYNYNKMMTNRDYKNKHRVELNEYSKKCKDMAGDDCWISYLVDQINQDDEHHIFIIDDLRMQCEYQFLKNAFDNIVFIRIEVPDSVRTERGWVLSCIDSHITEIDLDNYPPDKWDNHIDLTKWQSDN